MAINIHANTLLKVLKEYKDLGLIREKIWKNDSRVIFNISTPMEKIIEFWKKQPKDFKQTPHHYVLGLNS